MILMPSARRTLQEAISANPDTPLLLFPCIGYPSMRRLDSLTGDRRVTRDDLLYERVRGELIPVAKLDYLRNKGLQYPEFRSGGEGILWQSSLACSSIRQ
jgi:hypothetical protein